MFTQEYDTTSLLIGDATHFATWSLFYGNLPNQVSGSINPALTLPRKT